MQNDAAPTLKVIGYVRVSTKAQADSGLSIAVQGDRVRAFCRERKLDLVDVIEDGGRSGESLRRKGLREVFARLDAGEASAVVVAKLDRLTRSVRDFAGLVEDRFGPAGQQRLYSTSESLDLHSPGGRLIAYILVAFGECELDTGVDRSGSVMSDKKARGEQLGTIPFGSRLGADGRTLVEDPAEAGAIRAVIALRKGGLTFRAIAAELDRIELPTRNGKPWSHSTIAKILGREIDQAEAIPCD